ncbi:MAG: hypothetical protein WBQ21_00125 [Solirubrobacteraceae bacterium]
MPDNEADVSPGIGAWDYRTMADAVTRTYRGRTVEELIPRIQTELGADAIILSRREGLTGGFAGFFQRSFVEIEAMAGTPGVDVYDEQSAVSAPPFATESVPEPQVTRTPFYAREPPRSRPNGAYVSEHLAALAEARPLEDAPALDPRPLSESQEFQEYGTADPSDRFAAALEQASSAASFAGAEAAIPAVDVAARSAGVGGGLAGAPAESPSLRRGPAPAGIRAGAPARVRAGYRRPAPSSRGRAHASIQRQLIGLGVGEQFAGELIDGAATHILPLAPRAGLTQAVRSALTQRIPVAPPLPTRGAAIMLVGPGGAGKTSCAAALLAAYRKSSILPASCATLIRGDERGELQMLLSPHVMRPVQIGGSRAIRAMHKTRGEGLLVIDTPPLSPGDRSGTRKLAALLGELKPERVVVVLPATLGAVAAAQLLQALRPLGANALAVTHADETDQIGVAVEAACGFGLAPEYTLDRGRSGGWRLSRMDPTGLAAKLLP